MVTADDQSQCEAMAVQRREVEIRIVDDWPWRGHAVNSLQVDRKILGPSPPFRVVMARRPKELGLLTSAKSVSSSAQARDGGSSATFDSAAK
jgi:hypothetical protein